MILRLIRALAPHRAAAANRLDLPTPRGSPITGAATAGFAP